MKIERKKAHSKYFLLRVYQYTNKFCSIQISYISKYIRILAQYTRHSHAHTGIRKNQLDALVRITSVALAKDLVMLLESVAEEACI